MTAISIVDYETIIKLIQKKEIKWIQTHFTDLFGGLRVLHIPADQFIKDNIIVNGIGIDGSSVGLTNVEKSDMIVIPDKKTFLILPHENKEARVIANVYDTSLKPYPIDPRNILINAVKKAKKLGFENIKISPEMEFFVLSNNENGNYKISNNGGYLSPSPFDNAKEYRKKLSELLIDSGFNLKYHHHENGKSQHEVEIKSLNAVEAADFCVYFKYLAREIASRENLGVTFMPKPFASESGNGMHAHICIYNSNKNIFYDKNDKYNLSKIARFFIGGIMKHAKGLAVIANPTVNSYKRLISNYEAPVYIAWASHNRSSLLRIAAKKDVDIEIRNADPSVNPYLFFAAVIYSGLDGIKHNIEYQPIEKNIYDMSENEIKNYGIKKLPSNLFQAIEEYEKDNVLNKSLGKDFSTKYIKKKKEEFQKYMNEITDIDYKFYFNS